MNMGPVPTVSGLGHSELRCFVSDGGSIWLGCAAALGLHAPLGFNPRDPDLAGGGVGGRRSLRSAGIGVFRVYGLDLRYQLKAEV